MAVPASSEGKCAEVPAQLPRATPITNSKRDTKVILTRVHMQPTPAGWLSPPRAASPAPRAPVAAPARAPCASRRFRPRCVSFWLLFHCHGPAKSSSPLLWASSLSKCTHSAKTRGSSTRQSESACSRLLLIILIILATPPHPPSPTPTWMSCAPPPSTSPSAGRWAAVTGGMIWADPGSLVART
jgi:hypothetical protein